MSTRDLTWLRTEVCKALSVDPDNIDSAFSGSADDPWSYIDGCIVEAIDEEMSELEISSDPTRLMESQTIFWPSNQQRMTLPSPLDQADILRVDDETHVTPGDGVPIYDRNSRFEPEVSWYDKNTLQWRMQGPGEDKTLRFFYIAEPGDIIGASAEPIYIPRRFRWVLVYGAAINARDKQGENHPVQWERKKIEWRERMHLAFSKGRPRDPNSPQQGAAGSEQDVY